MRPVPSTCPHRPALDAAATRMPRQSRRGRQLIFALPPSSDVGIPESKTLRTCRIRCDALRIQPLGMLRQAGVEPIKGKRVGEVCRFGRKLRSFAALYQTAVSAADKEET